MNYGGQLGFFFYNYFILFLFLVNLIRTFFIACNSGKYGEDCNNTCGFCSEQNDCSHVNGTCFSGCDLGYTGALCKTGMFKIFTKTKTDYSLI